MNENMKTGRMEMEFFAVDLGIVCLVYLPDTGTVT